MGGLGGMLVVSSGEELIVKKVELCRKWMVGRAEKRPRVVQKTGAIRLLTGW